MFNVYSLRFIWKIWTYTFLIKAEKIVLTFLSSLKPSRCRKLQIFAFFPPLQRFFFYFLLKCRGKSTFLNAKVENHLSFQRQTMKVSCSKKKERNISWLLCKTRKGSSKTMERFEILFLCSKCEKVLSFY